MKTSLNHHLGRSLLVLAAVLCPHLKAGDLLRGNAPANARTAPGNQGATAATIDQSRAQYNDNLARTSRAIQAARALQNQARINAGIKGVNNLGQGLPVITDGLGPGGLLYRGIRPGFEGGNLAPTQAQGANGRMNVTVKQLQ
jgi:hypothetical protein